jgi:ribonuclease G
MKFKKRFFFDEKRLKRIEIQNITDEPMVDDIYTGQIVNYVPAIKAYFIDFNGYSGLLKSNKKYKIGQVIPVVVVKERRDDKGYRLSDLIYFKSKHVIFFPDDHKNRSSLKLSKSRVGELIRKFGDQKGILFRTDCETCRDDVIAAEITVARKAHSEALRYANIRETGKHLHRYSEETLVIEDLTEILELEELVKEHYASEKVLESRMRVTFEKTKLGTVVDCDSYRYQGTVKEDYLEMNRVMIQDILEEIEIRDVGGMILVDLISMKSSEEREELLAIIERALKAYPSITHHGITSLDILQLTRKVQRQGLMSYTEGELLRERLYLRIKALKSHVTFDKLAVHLNDRYYPEKNLLVELEKTFDFPIEFIYNQNVEDYSVKLNNLID